MVRTTANGSAASVQPKRRWSSQYSPATNVARSGGLLEKYSCVAGFSTLSSDCQPSSKMIPLSALVRV